MEIISIPFLVFVLVVLIVYYLLSQKAQNYWLLLASYLFYGLWNVWFVPILVITTLWNFFIARKIWQDGKNRKYWLIFGILIDLLSLSSLKVIASGWFTQSFEANLTILIPIGFSFYILQAISYLFDVQNKRLPASSNLIDFALYMAFFPKMLSGPIERARVFLPKLASPRIVDSKKLADGFTLILIGLLRKLIFAQLLSTALPKTIFTNIGQYTGASLLCALILYAFWLYNDFAGYTSLVRGISLLFGIELTANFQQPYFSRNFTEFWNRWHISLSHWLRDYIFFPVSRWLARHNTKKNNLINIAIPPILTMLASGLWHNFSISMLLWGCMHAFYQISERLISLWRSNSPVDQQPAWKQFCSALVVFCLTLGAWVPFATGSFTNTIRFFRMVIGQSFLVFPGATSLPVNQLILPGIMILLSVAVDWCQYHWQDETIFNKIRPIYKGILLALVLLTLAATFILQTKPVATFIYQGF